MGERGPDRELDETQILQFIHDSYGPAVGTTDIAEYFDVTGETVRNYLTRLKDGGYVDSRKVGRATAWWLTTDGERRIAGRQSDNQ